MSLEAKINTIRNLTLYWVKKNILKTKKENILKMKFNNVIPLLQKERKKNPFSYPRQKYSSKRKLFKKITSKNNYF